MTKDVDSAMKLFYESLSFELQYEVNALVRDIVYGTGLPALSVTSKNVAVAKDLLESLIEESNELFELADLTEIRLRTRSDAEDICRGLVLCENFLNCRGKAERVSYIAMEVMLEK